MQRNYNCILTNEASNLVTSRVGRQYLFKILKNISSSYKFEQIRTSWDLNDISLLNEYFQNAPPILYNEILIGVREANHKLNQKTSDMSIQRLYNITLNLSQTQHEKINQYIKRYNPQAFNNATNEIVWDTNLLNEHSITMIRSTINKVRNKKKKSYRKRMKAKAEKTTNNTHTPASNEQSSSTSPILYHKY